MGYNRRSLSTLVAVLLVSVVQLNSVFSHHHHQVPHSQQQVESGKIVSLSGTPPLNRPARHAEDHIQYIDLSHPLKEDTIHWPGNKGFKHSMTLDGPQNYSKNGTYHVRSDEIDTAVHVGTHLDAPSHFGKDSWTVEKIPLERLIDVPMTVVDLSAKVKANRSYSFLKEDFERDGKSLVQANSVVLVYTGISQDWDKGSKIYFGTDTPTDISTMKSPGFSAEAAKYLVEQKVFGVGLDAVSADSSDRQVGPRLMDPVAHVAFNENNIYILENVDKNLERLIGKDSARLTIAPLPVVGGTGSPVRLVASLGHDSCHGHASNGAGDQKRSISSTILLIMWTCMLVIMV